MQSKNGFAKPLILMSILLMGTIGTGYLLVGPNAATNTVDSELLFTAFRGEFVSSIMETGTVESSSNEVIKCEVKSRGSAGTAILEIIPEGEMVSKGDFLVQFDDSSHRDRHIEQQIEVAQNLAALIQAENDLNAAKKMVLEYNDGDGSFEQEKEAIEAEIAVAEETLQRAKRYFQFSQKLNAKNFISRSELEADGFAVEKADSELRLARGKLKLLTKLTRSRTQEQLEAEVRKLEAMKTAAEFTLKLSQEREKEFKEQVEKCRIHAPKAGQVVYANENDRDNSIIIEEGTIIRDGQEVIFLPDPNRMQIRTKVNDSKINLVSPGDQVEIRLDSAPDSSISGKVRAVAKFPLPQRWYQAPIEYEVFVDVTEQNPLVKTGLRAKSKIIVDRQQEVLQIPASSLVRRNGIYYALVVKANQIAAQQVEIGANNDKFVIVRNGLEPGDQVLINPEQQKEKVDYPQS